MLFKNFFNRREEQCSHKSSKRHFEQKENRADRSMKMPFQSRHFHTYWFENLCIHEIEFLFKWTPIIFTILEIKTDKFEKYLNN